MHEPPEQRLRFGATSEPQQRLDQEIGIADPAESIIPVAHAANFFGQRGGRRRRRCARRREDQHLQRKRAADDHVAPGSVVRAFALGGPGAPEVDRVRDAAFDGHPAGQNQRLGVRAREDQERSGALTDLECSLRGVLLPLRDAGVPTAERHRIAAARGHGHARAPFAARTAFAIVEPRREAPSHGNHA